MLKLFQRKAMASLLHSAEILGSNDGMMMMMMMNIRGYPISLFKADCGSAPGHPSSLAVDWTRSCFHLGPVCTCPWFTIWVSRGISTTSALLCCREVLPELLAITTFFITVLYQLILRVSSQAVPNFVTGFSVHRSYIDRHTISSSNGTGYRVITIEPLTFLTLPFIHLK